MEEKTLLEWYSSLADRFSKDELINAFKKQEVVQADLTDGGAEGAPQDIIQKEMLKALNHTEQKLNANDNVIAMDKNKIYKSLGLMQALERILIVLDSKINPYEDDPLAQQDLIDKAKRISNQINELISEL